MKAFALAVPALILAMGTASASLPAPPPEIAAIPVSMLVDLGSGQSLTARQPDLRFVPASMAKVMTAYVALAEMQRGRLDPDRSFTVPAQTAQQWNGKGTSMYLLAGQEVPLDMLLRGIATASANDAAVVLAEGHAGSVANWTALMNWQANRLGMRGSRFATPSGWPDEGRTFVTARDLVTLGSALIRDYPLQYRRYFGQKRMEWAGATLESRDPTVGIVPGADGIKTGHTAEAGYNFLGSAERDGRRMVMVIGGAGSEAERAAASRALLEWGFAQWQARPLFAPGKPVAVAQVQNGAARRVSLVGAGAIHASLPANYSGPIRLTVLYTGPLVAPVAKGAQVAELEVRVGHLPPGRVPLYAARAIAKAGPFDRLVNGLAGLLP